MRVIRPIPRALARPFGVLILAAWAWQMGTLVTQAYLESSPVSLAADLSRYVEDLKAAGLE